MERVRSAHGWGHGGEGEHPPLLLVQAVRCDVVHTAQANQLAGLAGVTAPLRLRAHGNATRSDLRGSAGAGGGGGAAVAAAAAAAATAPTTAGYGRKRRSGAVAIAVRNAASC